MYSLVPQKLRMAKSNVEQAACELHRKSFDDFLKIWICFEDVYIPLTIRF